jgi:hypothetical protein
MAKVIPFSGWCRFPVGFPVCGVAFFLAVCSFSSDEPFLYHPALLMQPSSFVSTDAALFLAQFI